MPTLPTLELTNDQYAMVVAAFPGDTDAEKAEAYRAWLGNRLIERVEGRLIAQVNAQREAEISALRATLPKRSPEPALPA